MRSKKLDMLVGEIRRQYEAAENDYEANGPAWPQVLKRMDMCKELINRLNKIYNTKYELKEN